MAYPGDQKSTLDPNKFQQQVQSNHDRFERFGTGGD